jgi:hypothetical protein
MRCRPFQFDVLLLLCLGFQTFFAIHGRAQAFRIKGKVVDAVTLKAIPFPIVKIDGDSLEYPGDMEGSFSIPVNGPKELVCQVRAYQYLFAEMKMKPGDSLSVPLHYAHPFTWQHISLQKEKNLISGIRKLKRKINPDAEKNYRYQSYNKSLVTTGNIIGLKLFLENKMRLFTRKRLGEYTLDHHIFLMESATNRVFRNRRKQKELVVATQVSGIQRPPPISFISGFDAMSIFDPFLRIGTKKYISPLAGRPFKRYAFSIIDSIHSPDGLILVLKFNPLSYRRKSLLQGILYISTQPTGIRAFHVWPAYDRESTFSLAQEAMLLPSGRWFPKVMRTSYDRNGLGALQIPLSAVSKTWIKNFTADTESKEKFDEVIFDLQHENLRSDTAFPENLRLFPLDKREQNTYYFYKQVGSLSGVDGLLNFGQKVLAGRFQLGKFDLQFRDGFKINDYEGLRLGLGLETNQQFSHRYQVGGYAGFGIKDRRWKFGAFAGYRLNENHAFRLSYQDNLSEPGIFPMAFDRRQYPSGDLRNLRVSRFDANRSLLFSWKIKLHPNFNVRLSMEAGRRDFLYSYQFTPSPDATGIDISEAAIQFCWNPGERYARIEQQLYPLVSGFPVFWLHFANGIPGSSGNRYNYNRLEGRLQWNRRILGFGDFGIRLSGGIQNRNLPYPLLFSSRGSFREFSLISYNSFETMRYNEFFYDRFFFVFMSHRLGKMQISTLPFLPYFTVVHNMGWGYLSNPELHRNIEAKDTRKGFFESGLFLNDLFVIPMAGADVGIGAGLFLRYGPYLQRSVFDNLVLKFSANLSM